jgi:hypothetical protein
MKRTVSFVVLDRFGAGFAMGDEFEEAQFDADGALVDCMLGSDLFSRC